MTSRALVLRVFVRYLEVIRLVQMTYYLERCRLARRVGPR